MKRRHFGQAFILLGMLLPPPPPPAERRKDDAHGSAQIAVGLLCASVCLIFAIDPKFHETRPFEPSLSVGFTLLVVNLNLSLISLLLATLLRSSPAAVLCAGILNGTSLAAFVLGSTACAVSRFGVPP